MRQPVGLAGDDVMAQAQPGQVAIDRRLQIPWLRARRVGIVDPQQEFAARLAREQEVQQRGAGIADMQKAGGRRRKADDDGHQRHPGTHW